MGKLVLSRSSDGDILMAAESMCSIKVGGSPGEMGGAELGLNSLGMLMESTYNFILPHGNLVL